MDGDMLGARASWIWGLSLIALLYSVDSMTMRGASGLMLQRHWRMMGALDGGSS